MKNKILCALTLVTFGLSFFARNTYGAKTIDGQRTADGDRLQPRQFSEFQKIPEKARVRPNPLQTDPDAWAAGKKLFAMHCAECHGESAEGSRKAPNLHAREVQNATPGELFWILTNGVVRHGMPVWSKLPEPERWQIVTFLKSMPTPVVEVAPGEEFRRHSRQAKSIRPEAHKNKTNDGVS